MDILKRCSKRHGQADRTAHNFVWHLSANYIVDEWECSIFAQLNLWAFCIEFPWQKETKSLFFNLDFVPEVREIVNAVVDQAPEAVDYVEKKYDSIVKKYSKGAVGKYDSPVPSDVWWYSWLPPKFIVDRNIRIANTIINGDGWAPPIKETINERLDFVEDQ